MTPRPGPDQLAPLDAVIDAARRDIAAGRPLDATARTRELEQALAALALTVRDAPRLAAAGDRAQAALQRLAALARARDLLKEPARYGPPAPGAAAAAPPPAPAPSARAALLAPKVTISGNLIVERRVTGTELTISWKLPPATQQVTVQLEERPDPRGDYLPVAQHELGTATSWTVGLDNVPKRIIVRVEGRGSRILGRARIAGLTAGNAASKWQRQATAA